jgi:beta-1,4-mannosyltransferase
LKVIKVGGTPCAEPLRQADVARQRAGWQAGELAGRPRTSPHPFRRAALLIPEAFLKVCMYPVASKSNEYTDMIASALNQSPGFSVFPFHYMKSFAQKFEIFHVHWPDATVYRTNLLKASVKVLAFITFVSITKMRSRRVVWTVHNLRSHERAYPVLERMLWRAFIPKVDCFIHMCEESHARLNELPGVNPAATHFLIPHPNYKSVFKHDIPQIEARKSVGIDEHKFVFMSFGLIQNYKGIDQLIAAFKNYHPSDAILLLVGEVLDLALADMLKAAADSDPRIIFVPRFVEREELITLIRATNIVVLAYKHVLNSGAAFAALTLGRPIVGPASGAIRDLGSSLGDTWVFQFSGDFETSVLVDARKQLGYQTDFLAPDLAFSDLDRVAFLTKQAYISVSAP